VYIIYVNTCMTLLSRNTAVLSVLGLKGLSGMMSSSDMYVLLLQR
jgi:hypothetical protein